MNFELNEEQQAILESIERLLDQHAGPARAVELNRDNSYDHNLHALLDSSGFSWVARDLASGPGSGKDLAGLEAALIVEAIARAGGVVTSAAQMLVAPGVSQENIAGPIALATTADLTKPVPLRFAAHAKKLLVLGDDDVYLIALAEGDFEAVRSSFGYPMGRAVASPRWEHPASEGQSLGANKASTMRNWWRLSLAIEAVGTMEAALNNTVEYLKQRRQFGRAIGSFQAVQHRLSLCAIHVEASRWLAREAAHQGAPEEAVAAAAAFALHAADQVFTETHQMSGAIGFTHEFNLHVWSMRLLALRQELDGVGGARRALVQARWGKTA
ncbi:MAG: alkylation response protein AidB-like acyl-CoA dehydrogenase [Halioglobus sp.]|jgi:alkylation response protein AidB-like acyl-CoA dehydrogenase